MYRALPPYRKEVRAKAAFASWRDMSDFLSDGPAVSAWGGVERDLGTPRWSKADQPTPAAGTSSYLI
jgi:hypothetical protein